MRLIRLFSVLLALFLCASACFAETDLTLLTGTELARLIASAQDELTANHTVSGEDAESAFALVTETAVSHYAAFGVSAVPVREDDSCLADWNCLSVRTKVEFDKGGGITHADPVSAFLVDGRILFLKCGTEIAVDNRAGITDEFARAAFRANFPDDILPEPESESGLRSADETAEAQDWVLNTNTMRFHKPSCSSATEMKESNRQDITAARQEVLDMGYTPCGRCKP